jgi:hypothetical protein
MVVNMKDVLHCESEYNRGAGCGKTARPDLYGGLCVNEVPTTRDIRRICKTLMGELGISKSIRDRLQNHALQDVSSKHYDRYEYMPEKLRALEVWERELNSVVVDNVIALGGQ